MITENGIVTDSTSEVAWIKTTRSGACESCSSKNSCGTATGQKEMIVTVPNTLKVEKGDHVVIGLATKPILFLTFLLYVFPIILLITGALIGNSLAPVLGLSPSLGSMAFGFSFFGMAFFIIRQKNNSLSKEKSYRPFLVRKRPHTAPAGCSLP